VARSVDELTRVDDPAWPYVVAMVEASSNDAHVLGCAAGDGEAGLWRLQMTARSMLGGIVLNCGAMVVDHGWVKVLGAGVPGLPGVAGVNGLPDTPLDNPPMTAGMIVAVDVLGGQFAIDGGGLGASPGEVCYWDPSAIAWIGLGAGHSAFVEWLLTGDLAGFYQDLRWDGWQTDTDALQIGQGVSVYPFPWASQFRNGPVTRAPAPIREIIGANESMAAQMGPQPPLPWRG